MKSWQLTKHYKEQTAEFDIKFEHNKNDWKTRKIFKNFIMNIETVLLKHLDWKAKFINAAHSSEHIDTFFIKSDTCCEVGEWLQEEGKIQYGHLPSYKACLNGHAEFHIEASKIASAINEKQFSEAKKLLELDSSFCLTALELWTSFTRLKNEANEK